MTNKKDTRVEELLPWLVNDSLSDDERAACEQRLGSDPDDRDAFQQYQALAEHMKQENDFQGLGEDLAWARLNREISKEEHSFWRSPLRLAASVAAVAALSLALVFSVGPNSSQDPSFTTLSTPPATEASGDVLLRLALLPTDSEQFEARLNERDAALVSQSPNSGVVVIRVAKDSRFSDPERWLKDANVRFAERVE